MFFLDFFSFCSPGQKTLDKEVVDRTESSFRRKIVKHPFNNLNRRMAFPNGFFQRLTYSRIFRIPYQFLPSGNHRLHVVHIQSW